MKNSCLIVYVTAGMLLFTGFVAHGQVADKAENIAPLLYGEKVPDAILTDTDGNKQGV